LNIGELGGPCGSMAPYVMEGAIAEGSVLQERQFWVVRPERSLAKFGPIDSGNCQFYGQVTRPLRGEQVVMNRTYVCEDY
jgi:hypothetical protein